MTNSTDSERRSSSLKSLLERLEEADKEGESTAHGARAARPELPRNPATGREREVSHDGVVPLRRRRPEEITPSLDKELGRAIERRAMMVDETAATYRMPLILGGAAVAGAVIALPVAYWLLSGPTAPATSKPVGTQAGLTRPVETTAVAVETRSPLHSAIQTPQSGSRDDTSSGMTAPVQPRLVQPPEQRTRRVAVEPLTRTEAPAATVPDVRAEPRQAVEAAPIIPAQPAIVSPPPPSQPPVALVPPKVAVEPALVMRSGTRAPFPLRIEPVTATQFVTRIVLRGLGGGIVVPQASRGPAGSMLITPDALAALTLDASQAAPGTFDLEIELQGSGQTVLDRATTVLTISPVAIAPAINRDPAPLPRPEAANPRGDAFLAKGKQLFVEGDVAGARLMLERAVDVGSPAAALILGETYDPAGLQARGVRGMTPDIKQARAWYEKARALGMPEANDRLQRLPAR